MAEIGAGEQRGKGGSAANIAALRPAPTQCKRTPPMPITQADSVNPLPPPHKLPPPLTMNCLLAMLRTG